MCFKGKMDEFEVSNSYMAAQLVKVCDDVFLNDNFYYYVSLEDWGKVLFDASRNLPKYTVEKFDCDKFSRLVRCRVNSVNQINGIGEVLGFPPPSWNYNGTHKWNIFFSNHGLYYFEPQDGDFWPVTEGEYIPLRIDF